MFIDEASKKRRKLEELAEIQITNAPIYQITSQVPFALRISMQKWKQDH